MDLVPRIWQNFDSARHPGDASVRHLVGLRQRMLREDGRMFVTERVFASEDF